MSMQLPPIDGATLLLGPWKAGSGRRAVDEDTRGKGSAPLSPGGLRSTSQNARVFGIF